MDEEAWWATVHGVAGSWTGLSNFTFTFHFSIGGNGNPLQCSACIIPGMGEPGGLPSMGRTESDTTEVTAAAAVCPTSGFCLSGFKRSF